MIGEISDPKIDTNRRDWMVLPNATHPLTCLPSNTRKPQRCEKIVVEERYLALFAPELLENDG